jgi:hypothetical protein
MMGRRKRESNHSLQKNNLIQDSEGNEESRCPVLDLNKSKSADTKEHSNAQKKSSKKKSCK